MKDVQIQNIKTLENIIITNKEGNEKERYKEEMILKYSRLLSCIPIGEANAITEKKIASEYQKDITIRSFQKLLSNARNDGVLICSNSNGLYIPLNISEIESFYKINRARSLTMLKLLNPIRKILKGAENGK